MTDLEVRHHDGMQRALRRRASKADDIVQFSVERDMNLD